MVFKSSSLVPLQRWCSIFQRFISGDGNVVLEQLFISGTFTKMVKFFQRFISGDGYLVFKSSLAPLQSLSSSFQRVIYGDGNMVFKASPLACFREMVQPFLYPEIIH